jgi:hypothetical protein
MVVPDPEYISLSGAISTIESYIPPGTSDDATTTTTKDVVITPNGLRTVNLFLDYILHEILARTKSTALYRLREGVALVIRTTLGTSAMANAEQELTDHAYIGETELHDDEGDEDKSVLWDLDKVWERARIICMVYSVLGDKEQDDFEDVMEEEITEQQLSTAAAIYLAAVLETVANHCLSVATKAAHRRADNSNSQLSQFTVEDTDVKRGIVEDDLTTRLWRKWKRSEHLLSTILPRSNSINEHARQIDLLTGSETLHELPFTPAQAAKELHRIDQRKRNSADLSQGENDSRTQSLPLPSPTKPSSRGRPSSGEWRRRHRRSRESGDSIDMLRFSDSVANIKETLSERGIILPESPLTPKPDNAGLPSSPTDSKHRVSTDFDIDSKPSSRPISSIENETPTPRKSTSDELSSLQNQADLEDDPLKTPTPKKTAQFFENSANAKGEDEDFYIVGGDAGFDVCCWPT